MFILVAAVVTGGVLSALYVNEEKNANEEHVACPKLAHQMNAWSLGIVLAAWPLYPHAFFRIVSVGSSRDMGSVFLLALSFLLFEEYIYFFLSRNAAAVLPILLFIIFMSVILVGWAEFQSAHDRPLDCPKNSNCAFRKLPQMNGVFSSVLLVASLESARAGVFALSCAISLDAVPLFASCRRWNNGGQEKLTLLRKASVVCCFLLLPLCWITHFSKNQLLQVVITIVVIKMNCIIVVDFQWLDSVAFHVLYHTDRSSFGLKSTACLVFAVWSTQLFSL